jgi:hypothetical protein
VHLLVTGTHRSGSTFVASMLALAPGTSPLFEILSPANPDKSRVRFEHWFQYVGRENEERYLEPLRRTLGMAPGLATRLRSLLQRTSSRRIVVKEPTAPFAAEWMAERLAMVPVLTIRHPAAFVASNRRLGWTYNLTDLLDQPLLLRHYLPDLEAEVRSAVASQEQLVHLSVLWKCVYWVVDGLRRRHPDWVFVRHEDVSRRPVSEFEALYRRLGLTMTPEARATIEEYTTRRGPYPPPEVADIRRNSSAHLRDWTRLLEPGEAERVRELTEPVAALFYADEDW